MSQSQPLNVPFVESVLHPTDFSPESEKAFAHALIIAREIAFDRRAKLTILHVGKEYPAEDEWLKFPPVRATLQRWGILQRDRPRSAVFEELGIGVKKVNLPGHDPLSSILEYLDHDTADLIVLATQGRKGLPRWLRPSFAERLAQQSKTMTLFVPRTPGGFVSADDGHIFLRRVLVPVDHQPCPQAAIDYAAQAASMTDEPHLEIIVVHVGNSDQFPSVDIPNVPNCSWQRVQRQGEVVAEIIRAAEEYNVDMISMATQGHQGILDALRGSVTEQVLRRAPCPLLAVPATRKCTAGEYRSVHDQWEQTLVGDYSLQLSLKKAYRTLGVSFDATLEEVKKAYRDKIAKCHPDKVSHLSEELQEKARELTLDLNNAFKLIKQTRTA